MTNNSVPGMIYPTQKAMLAGTPQQSAMASMNSKAQLQAQANKAMAGGKIKRFGGASGTIVVPQYQMQYQPQGGPGTNPNNQIQGNAQTATQGAANQKYDNYATVKGGSKRRKGGSNPNWHWGCMSGGRRTRKYKRKNRRKSCKRRKH